MNIYEGSAAAHVRPIAAIRQRAKRNGKTAGNGPGRLPIIALRVTHYASRIATISCVRGSMTRISLPTRM
jgi:hypothetical protein